MSRTIIIGGGIVGSCTACFLAGHGEVVVLEKDPSYQYASTTLSAASIRTQFSLPLNVRMSLFGAAFLEAMAERVGLVRRAYLGAGQPRRARRRCVPTATCRSPKALTSRCSKARRSPRNFRG